MIFLAEDNLPDVLLVREAIRTHNLDVDLHVASDGEEALRFITNAETDPTAPSADFLILDLDFPKWMDFPSFAKFGRAQRYQLFRS